MRSSVTLVVEQIIKFFFLFLLNLMGLDGVKGPGIDLGFIYVKYLDLVLLDRVIRHSRIRPDLVVSQTRNGRGLNLINVDG